VRYANSFLSFRNAESNEFSLSCLLGSQASSIYFQAISGSPKLVAVFSLMPFASDSESGL